MHRTLIIALAVFAAFLAGCQSDFHDAGRASRLMAMAAGEADQIKDPHDRLTALLNIADTQIRNGRYVDGRASLAKARATLDTPDGAKLDSLIRIAGWVSVSELSRRAGDAPTARAACKTAVGVLNAIQPVGQRCEYVRGVASELYHLDDKAAACDLLRQAGPWAGQIDNVDYRRKAQVAIACDLFAWDDYDGGKAVLAVDTDPAWRSRTLLNLAQQALPEKHTFGKGVTYEQSFASNRIMPGE